jgi:hypothetical protein
MTYDPYLCVDQLYVHQDAADGAGPGIKEVYKV